MNGVKQEPRADDDEINQLAAQILEQHRQKAAQTQQQQQHAQQQRPRVSGQASISSYFGPNAARSTEPATKSPEPSPDVLDTDSVRGRFGWSVIGTAPIPSIFRKGDRFCPVRAVEKNVLSPYLQKLPMDVCNCTSIKSYFVTENEAKLLNDINIRHCDHYFGREAFTSKDCIVRVDDAKQFSDFLALCERKMVNMHSKPEDRCGFLRINGESVVPFTVKRVKVGQEDRDVRFVPLFYFEGETEHLKHKAEQLTGWDLAYLKLCCKVQGIRSELFQSDTCDVVSLDDVKRHFPAGTQFQTWWPVKRFEFKLTNQPKPSFWECQPPPSSNQVTPVSQTTPRVSTTAPIATSRAQPAATGLQTVRSQAAQAWAASRMVANMLVTQQQQQQRPSAVHAQQRQQQQQQRQLQQTVQQRPVVTTVAPAQLYLANGVLTAVNGQAQQPLQSAVPRLSAASALTSSWVSQQQLYAQMQLTGAGVSAFNNSNTPRHENGLGSGASTRPANSVPNGRQAPPLLPMASAKRAVPNSAAVDEGTLLDRSRLMPLPLSPPNHYSRRNSNSEPYLVQKTTIESRTVQCINGSPYDYTALYVSVHDLVKTVFPKVTVRAFQEILGVLGIAVFKASTEQLMVLSLNGCYIPLDRVIGLVRFTDLLTFMPQIGYIYSSQASQAEAKRMRS